MSGGAVAAGLLGLAEAATRLLQERWGRAPVWLVAAPGRVNLIGEHTDYNGGFVLPMAIDRHVLLGIAPAGDSRPRRVRFYSREIDSTVEIGLDELPAPGPPAWANYVRGVVAGFLQRGATVPALDIVAVSDLPLGGGLASSAALEVATATALEAAAQIDLPALDKARLCQHAEQRFAGVPCGIMDQLVVTLGDPAGALLIDCETEVVEAVPWPARELTVLVCNSGVQHALGDGAYARRREECAEAARILDVPSLRATTPARVEEARGALGPILHRRARHVTSENARTLSAARAFAVKDHARAGALLYESHQSLREDFEVSCPELDVLVDIAREIGVAGGVWGARLTGGGFGGCTITLAQVDQAAGVAETMRREYARRTGLQTKPFEVRPTRGAHLLPSLDKVFV